MPTSELLDLTVKPQSLPLVHISMPSFAATSSDTHDEGRPSKMRRVRFSEDCTNSTARSLDTVITSSAQRELNLFTKSSLIDLCSGGDLCTQLCSPQSTRFEGYIDGSYNLRHHIYSYGIHKDRSINSRQRSELTSLNTIFNHPVEKSISISQQIRLALNLVQSVLQFHSTPWLRPYWRLQDLSYFEVDRDLAVSLSTLHIGTELSPSQQCDSLMTDAAGDVLDAQLACGIRNLTMHSLGVALLQIGQWDPLKPDDIVEVRKMADIAERDSRLGPRYQKITQQCLDCDFGFGKDLSQIELQNAIYRDVVCELQALIQALEGNIPTVFYNQG